jgi:hypothetical protein
MVLFFSTWLLRALRLVWSINRQAVQETLVIKVGEQDDPKNNTNSSENGRNKKGFQFLETLVCCAFSFLLELTSSNRRPSRLEVVMH